MTTEQYLKSTHRLGRIGVAISVLLLIAVPTVVCLYYDVMPNIMDVVTSLVPLLTLFIPLAFSEVFSYTPLLGTSTYLTFLSGNIMNLKLPAVINAIEIAQVEEGSEASDVISGIAVAVSSIVTMLIIILGVLLLVPLQPLLESESVQIASKYVVPSLFGALGLGILGGRSGGGVEIQGKLYGVILSVLLMIIVFFSIGAHLTEGLSGVLILINLPIIYFSSKWLYKKGKITVKISGNKQA